VPRDESVRQAVRAALNEMGPDVVADAARSCGDAYPPPGQVGAFPHRRTGTLAAAFSYRVEDGPNGPIFVLSNAAPYASFVNASRPFLQLTMDKWGPRLTQATADAIAAAGKSSGNPRTGGVRGFVGRVASSLSSGFRSFFGS
jgi:hypothetical protein